jgi:hypothetical protein
LRDMGGGSIIDALKKNDGLKALEWRKRDFEKCNNF